MYNSGDMSHFHLPHDLGTWAFILSVLAIVLMYPVGLVINLTTPLVQNWIAKRSKASLEKRISKLETTLTELEQYPPTDEVQDRILWEIKHSRLSMRNVSIDVVVVVFLGIQSLSNVGSQSFHNFAYFAYLVLGVNAVMMLVERYHHDFRYERSPNVRKRLKTEIDSLKTLRDNWPTVS